MKITDYFMSNFDSSKLTSDTKMAVFWVVAPCSRVEVYQRFRGPSSDKISAGGFFPGS
jgi:hypothetical protein